jgi:hypothetical protein
MNTESLSDYVARKLPHLTKVSINEEQTLTPHEMSDRQFLGWNVQTRSQLVDDLYYTCRQNGEILEELLDEYVYLLKDNTDRLDILANYVKEELGEEE